MSKRLKPSQFNVATLDEAGNLIILNTFSGKLCRVAHRHADEMQTFLKGGQAVPETINPVFIEKGYFVDALTDELALYKSRCFETYDTPILEISVLPTHKCNCRCVYCYERFQGGMMSEEIQDALVRFAKDKLQTCSGLHISWFGGEPLVGMDIIRNLSTRLMSLCKTMHKAYSSSITTNGTLLTPETFAELQKYRVIFYQITIDGTKSVHDLQRPLAGEGSSYDMIMENLKAIKSARRGPTFHILLRINLTKKNMDELEPFLLELDKNFGGDRRFNLNINIAGNWGGDRVDAFKENLFDDDTDMDRTRDQINRIIQENHLSLQINGFGSGIKARIGSSTGCYVNKKNFYTVDPTGAIFKCEQEERNLFPPLGQLATYKGLNDIKAEQAKWDSVIFPELPEKCKNCAFIPVGCWGVTVCPLVKYTKKYGDPTKNDQPLCPEHPEQTGSGNEPHCHSGVAYIDEIMREMVKDSPQPIIEDIYVTGE